MKRILQTHANMIRNGLPYKPMRFYDSKVVEYFENPPNVGKLDKKKVNVGTGMNS